MDPIDQLKKHQHDQAHVISNKVLLDALLVLVDRIEALERRPAMVPVPLMTNAMALQKAVAR
jgi:hypothetical protein